MIVRKGSYLFRGGSCNGNFFTFNSYVARLYGKLCTFKASKDLRMFVLTHDSLKSTFKYLSEDTKLIMSFVFGTGLLRKDQEKTYRKITGLKSVKSVASKTPGKRLSLTEFDSVAFRAFAKEFLLKKGFDGMYMPTRFTTNKKVFHSEIYIPNTKGRLESSRIQNIPELFIKYTKGTTRLIKPYRHFIPYLGGGMAIKMYLRARGINTAKTSDFDFKFAVPRSIRTQKQIDALAELMKRIMEYHVSGFVRFLNRMNIRAVYTVRELAGVPTNKPGGPNYKKVYKVYNFSIVTPEKTYELVDTSLVVVPGITRKTHLSKKWSNTFKIPIQNLQHMWKDTLYVLAGSFVKKSIMLRNPINGDKKEKGIKNAIRTGHLSYLTAKRKKSRRLVTLARRLIDNVASRNKRSGIKHSRQILKLL